MTTSPNYCAIDFGTSNSAITLPAGDGSTLVPVEAEHLTMPTAVFYLAEGPGLASLPCLFGRTALAAYLEGAEGRLMRSMKSVLGTSLLTQHTDIGAGRSVSFADVIAGYLRQLKQRAEAQAGSPLRRVVLGRPVFFVDDDIAADAAAQAALELAARSVGFDEVAFQFEPIAAALHYEQGVQAEQRVLVADIGGGTSDFSVVRLGPGRRGQLDRREDVLANHGLHVAGTDFDRRIELTSVLPALGFRTLGPSVAGQAPREVPSRIYFDLATWHLINTLYRPQRLQELRAMRVNFADLRLHDRLTTTVRDHLGHDLLGRAEQAKIELSAAAADAAAVQIDMGLVERGLLATLTARQAQAALQEDVARIVQAGQEAVRRAGLRADQVDALYFTGGSTGLSVLTDALSAAFPAAKSVQGERLASVATGLGLYARRLFGQALSV